MNNQLTTVAAYLCAAHRLIHNAGMSFRGARRFFAPSRRQLPHTVNMRTVSLNPIRISRAALLLGLIGGSAFAQNSPATSDTPDKDRDVVTLEKFQVTGSHISGIDAAGLNPVTSISRATLDMGGYTNVGDALRSLSFVTGSSLIPSGSGNSFTPGASTANLRGLGNNNVLVLVNGRRLAPLATPGFNGLQTVFDFNAIPSAAVESIQVLKDGGSAVYGSDAVSGVINVILRQNYSGLSTEIGFGNTVGTDSLEKTASVVVGANSGKISIVTEADWKDRNGINDADYGFSSNADLTSRGGPDLRSYAGFPGLAYVPSLGDYYTLSAPKAQPTIGDFQVADVSHGSYNFQSASGLSPEERSFGFYTHAKYEFNDQIYGFAEVLYRRTESTIAAAPTPVFNYTEHGTGPATGYLNIPANNPNNPFGENLEDEWYARLVNAGNRVNKVTSETPRFIAGLGGKLPNSWEWETAALYTKNKTDNLNGGTVFDNLYQAALNGVTIGGQTLYANPFGPEDPRVTATYTSNNPTSATFEIHSYDLSANGPIFDLPAGQVKIAFGGEWRTEELANYQTINNATGNVVGGSEGTSTFGERTVKAAYAELRIPLITNLQLQLAGRYEQYSDFGSTTKPKIALSYRPVPWLLLRTSYGQSFLAPNLAYLYTSKVTTFSNSPLIDPKRPNDAARQIQTQGGGNPDLQPEETDALYAGFQINPTGRLQGLEFSVDWLQFKQKNLIDQLGEDYILSHEDTLPGRVVRNAPAAGETFGVINYLNDTYANINRQTYRGFDVEVRYTWSPASIGRLTFELGGTYLEKLHYINDDLAGTYDLPRWRGTGSVAWKKGDWAASVLFNYVGSFDNY